jgi:hypothetical protein
VILGVHQAAVLVAIVAAPGGLCGEVDLEPEVLLACGVEDQVSCGDVLGRDSDGLVQRDLSG